MLVRTIGAIAAVAALALGAQPAFARPADQNPRLPVRERVADLLARMTLDEKIGQMTQAERGAGRRRPDARSRRYSSARPVRRRLGADAEHAGGVGRHGRPLPARGAGRPGCSIPLIYGDRRGARPRQHARRHGLPAQHRPRRHPRPAPGAARSSTSPPRRRAPPGRSGPSRRASAWPATTAGAAPTRASARTRAGRRGWRPRSTACRARRRPGRPRPGAGHRQALRRRRRHRVRRPPTGDYTIDQGVDQVTSRAGLLADWPAPVRPRRAASTTSAP